jgi:hypothetical protein
LAEDVWSGLAGVFAAPVAAAAGTLAWMGQDETYERHTIARWHPDTGLRPLPGSGPLTSSDPLSRGDNAYVSLRLSADGEQLLLIQRRGPMHGRLLVSPASQFGPRVVPTNGSPYAAMWQADGGITYAARASAPSRFAIYSAPPGDRDEPSRHRELFASPRPVYPTSWDPAGRHLVYNELFPDRNWQVYYYDVATGEPSRPATSTSRPHEIGGDLSPDGSWIAFHGAPHAVFVEPFLGADAEPQSIGSDWAQLPRWVVVDNELYLYFFSQQFGNLARARVHLAEDADRFSPPDPVGLPPDPAVAVATATGYRLIHVAWPIFDVGPDGTIFVLLQHRGERRRVSVRVESPGAAQ